MVSTFPPTQCGIATFAESLTNAMTQHGGRVEIVDLPTSDGEPPHDAVLHRHRGAADAMTTASVLNSHDVVILQHEFGIWDGDDGQGIIDLLSQIKVPVITVLHTVPAVARGGQRHVLQRLLDVSDAIVTLSHSAQRRLAREFAVRPRSVRMIPHGAPIRWPLRKEPTGALDGRLLTWGLLGDGKGLEWGIRAVAELDRRGLAVEYVIAGATHPNVLRTHGETYRQSLRALAKSLRIGHRVVFADGYLSSEHLSELIRSATAFLLPYDSREQITSGVLVEAVAAGGPVVATRFPHAIELLSAGAGVLVDHRDSVGIADGIERLLRDPNVETVMRDHCRAVSADFAWASVGQEYLQLADRLWRGYEGSAERYWGLQGVSA